MLGELPGVGDYESIRKRTVDFDLYGVKCRVLDIPTLIQSKTHANRRKDQQAVAELKVILQRIEQLKRPR